ncbi:MAG: tripartite tricarboxylate transporter substrate binding protein [Pseudorhodoplanes sp.]
MTSTLRRSACAGMAAVAWIMLAGPAAAQTEDVKSFPSRPIRIVVPASPGGVNDILARLVGQKMSESFGQPVVIENKPGAATILGAETVARSAPDGYTMLIAPTATMAINPAVYTKLSYKPQTDFIPLSAIATYPYVLAASAAAPAKSVKELIEFAKANPDKANAGGASVTFQLLIELFKTRTGAPIQYIPYKGANDANLALIAGQLTVSFLDIAPATPNIQAGKIKALAVTAPARLSSLPDVPTMAESGLKDMTVESWAGLFLPAGTPAPIVQKLQDEVMRIVRLPDFQEKLKAQELVPVGNTSKEFETMLAKDIALWADVARAANVKVD